MFHNKTEICLENLDKNPRCPHGPSILFEDTVKGKKRKYWACSAYRDKKSCDFYVSKKQKITQGTRFKWEENEKIFMRYKDHKVRYAKLAEFKRSGVATGSFCQTCEVICDPTGHPEAHKLSEFDAKDLVTPTKLLVAKSENKKEAQYFFNSDTLGYLKDAIKSTGVTHVLCLGTPTLFQALPKSINKLLLDIDSRYLGLLSPEEFCWSNMMNFHFFQPQISLSRLQEFIRSSNSSLAVIVDPPFGARPELIINTLNNINTIIKKSGVKFIQPNIFWVFPYFHEKKLKECKELKMNMCHYRLGYMNHKEYSGGEGGRKQGSPVRLFTNLPLGSLPLPREDGYKHCPSCSFFVADTNVHCKLCNACTSKDGRPYVHCEPCGRCVKETYVHCESCSRCHLTAFKCTKDSEEASKEADKAQPPPKENPQKQSNKRKKKNNIKKNGKKRSFF